MKRMIWLVLLSPVRLGLFYQVSLSIAYHLSHSLCGCTFLGTFPCDPLLDVLLLDCCDCFSSSSLCLPLVELSSPKNGPSDPRLPTSRRAEPTWSNDGIREKSIIASVSFPFLSLSLSLFHLLILSIHLQMFSIRNDHFGWHLQRMNMTNSHAQRVVITFSLASIAVSRAGSFSMGKVRQPWFTYPIRG